MKEKNKLRIMQILCVISILITVFSIQRAYAKYIEKLDTTYASNIKRWIIEVNEKNIHNETTLTNVMTPQFFYNENMNTNNTLVPGRVGYFDFLIDYTNVDVPFKFAFNLEQLNENQLADFEVFGYKVIDPAFNITSTTTVKDIGEITELTKTDGVYQLSGLTQEIDPTVENTKNKRVLVLFRWNDGADNTMDNAADTVFKGTELKYKVNVTFTQKI